MPVNRLVEYVFFFGLLVAVAYLVWLLIEPFFAALALAAIIVTITYPLHQRILALTPKHNKTVASLLSVILVIFIVILPLAILGSFLLREALSVYSILNDGSQFTLEQTINDLEQFGQALIPGFSLDVTGYVQSFAGFIASNIGAIFAGTASTIFAFFITLIASFYFFREGDRFTKYLVEVSPLPDDEDEVIIDRLGKAIRSVSVGIVLVAIIQGVLTGIGLAIFGFERAVLWGSIAAIGALIPGIGTSIVFIPAVIYLAAQGAYLMAAGVAIWGALAVGLIDNILGPYLMSRGNALHPFLVLLSVLGGIALFGPVGFVLGPVSISLFKVLLELYSEHIAETAQSSN